MREKGKQTKEVQRAKIRRKLQKNEKNQGEKINIKFEVSGKKFNHW